MRLQAVRRNRSEGVDGCRGGTFILVRGSGHTDRRLNVHHNAERTVLAFVSLILEYHTAWVYFTVSFDEARPIPDSLT
jgi:predicted RNase H-like nuclease